MLRTFPNFLLGGVIMTLYILNPGIQPLGDFDVLDTDLTSIVGGECMVLDEASRSITSTEKAAADVLDGYIDDQIDIGNTSATRTIARIADTTSETYNVFYLADDGKAGYGVIFGEVIGNPTGLNTSGTNLGPHTAQGSGKVTLWDKAGLYGISLTALTNDVVPNTSGNLYDTPLPGTLLYRAQTTGLLTRATASADKIALFVELTSNGSLVTTPSRLTGATETFDRIKVQYLGATHNA